VGGHLAETLLLRDEYELHGLSRRGVYPEEWAHLRGKVTLHTHDLVESPGLPEMLASIRPDWIVHLAGYAHAGRSHQEPDAAWRGNLDATRHLLDAVKKWAGKPRILTVSTGLIYGNARGLCDESRPLLPTSPYAASKAAADLAAYQYSAADGLDIVRARPFNHIGPRQTADYAIPRFASQLAAIERGLQPPVLETYNLSAFRDLSDVRDIVRAYILLLKKGRSGEAYNIGLGHCVRIGEALNRLLAMSSVKVEVRSHSEIRPPDTSDSRCDITRVKRETGWEPHIPLDKTLRDTLDYWRAAVQQL
jgi:GDP-4-dehydro-6-deoxy-D-mannose reductase